MTQAKGHISPKHVNSTLTRRAAIGATAAALAGGAALNLTAIAATRAAEPDPVFAAIEAYKRAAAFHHECLVKADALEQRFWNLKAEYDGDVERARVEAGMDECWGLRHLGGDAERAAEDALLATVPMTSAGLLAMITLMVPDGKPLSPLRWTFSRDNEQVAAFMQTLAAFVRERA